jgi:hypothetical protein
MIAGGAILGIAYYASNRKKDEEKWVFSNTFADKSMTNLYIYIYHIKKNIFQK